MPVPPDVQAPQLSEQLFALGADMLLRHLPEVLARGRAAAEAAAPQDEAAATYAHKVGAAGAADRTCRRWLDAGL